VSATTATSEALARRLAAAVPTELRARQQWVLWRSEARDGKATKVPLRVSDPSRRASSTDPASWASFEQALAAVGAADGLGFVFSSLDGFCGVDLDGCVSEDGELEPRAAAIVERLASYSELSPSGTGVHVLVKAELNGSRRRAPGFEVYSSARFFTVTGRRLGEREAVEERQVELDALVREMLPAAEKEVPSSNGARPRDEVLPDDHELLERAFAAKNGAKVEALFRGELNGHGSHSEADLALCSALAFYTGPNAGRLDRLFRESGLMREKWNRDDYRQATIAKALERSEFFEPPAQTPPKHAEAPAGGGDDREAREALAELLGLPSVGLTIAGARIVGRGSRASADLYLSDSTEINFETLRDFGTPRILGLEIAAAAGARPTLKAQQALEAVVLLRRISERRESFTRDQVAFEWGASFLQSARALEVDMNNREARWEAFSELERIEPRAAAREQATSLARASAVLMHTDGSRFVRSGWFFDYVRAQDVSAGGNADIATRMERVGWSRRGGIGRIKATRKDFPGQLAWSFFEGPLGWEVGP